ncbi:MAG: branched-chain amino acid transaminase [bacterium]|nr:branched-chain amino acid transaminase [bacterium]
MEHKNKKIWMDGSLIDYDQAKVHILTHSLHYGLGVFEGIRCYKTSQGTSIFRLEEHLDRFFHSAAIVYLSSPFSKEALREAIKETIRENQLEAGYIRPIMFIGDGAMGIYAKGNPVRVAIAVWPWGSYLGEEGLEKGVRIRISSYIRQSAGISLHLAKLTGNYIISQLAKREAVQDGYDEALLLDQEGFVAEGPGENIFMVRDGVLYTPPTDNILEGITRDSIIKIAERENIQVVVRRFTRDELYIADEAFFCGTAAEVTPIREVDGHIIDSGRRGEVTHRLQQIYFDVVHGRNPAFSSWLTYV